VPVCRTTQPDVVAVTGVDGTPSYTVHMTTRRTTRGFIATAATLSAIAASFVVAPAAHATATPNVSTCAVQRATPTHVDIAPALNVLACR
jgi:hypothetical protein